MVNAGKIIFDGFAQILSNIWNAIKSAASSAWEALKSIVLNLIDGLVKGAQNAWDTMQQAVSDLVSAVTNIFDSIKNINLWEAGKAILDGFLGGLKSAWNAVTDFVGGIASWIAEHKGPIEYDRKLLIPAGNAIMDGLNEGLKNSFLDVQKTVSKMTEEISTPFDNLETSLDSEINLNPQVTKTMEVSANLYEPEKSDVSIEIISLKEKISALLKKLIDKDTTMYLDGEIVAQNTYQRHADIFAREGI